MSAPPPGEGRPNKSGDKSSAEPVTLGAALRVWAYIGLNSFGGPTGQIAVMHRVLVDQKRWISPERFMHALNYCMLLPGPEAMQLATYVGWLLHRTAGGLIAGALFVLPGFISILVLSIAYTTYQDSEPLQGLLLGMRAAVLAIIVHALARLAGRILRNRVMIAVALSAFAAIFLFQAPFPLVIVAAALVGLAGDRFRPDLFELVQPQHAAASGERRQYLSDSLDATHTHPSAARSIRTLVIWGGLWLIPVALLGAVLGPGDVFFEQGVFFSKVAVFTFGGAYAVLAYVAQQAVEAHGWLEPGEMLTGLGLAETTPGPLIQVVQFVGYMGAWRDPGSLHPITAGVLASLLVTWVTFVPCFLWIFLGAPYVERVRKLRRLSAALSCITAAVTGVILNLALWFALHALFAEIVDHRWGPLRLMRPEISSFHWPTALISAVCLALIFRARWGVLPVLAIAIAAGILWRLSASF